MESDYFYTNLNVLYKSKNFSDVTVNVGPREFHCHKIILAAASPFFEAMFTNEHLSEANCKNVSLSSDTVEENSFEIILNFIYSRCLSGIDEENVYSVLACACFLLMEQIEIKCCQFIAKIINSDNYLELVSLAGKIQSQQLNKLVHEYGSNGFAIVAGRSGFTDAIENGDYFEQISTTISDGTVTDNAFIKILNDWQSKEPASRSETCLTIMSKFKSKFGTLYCNSAVNFLTKYDGRRWETAEWSPYNTSLPSVTLFNKGKGTLGIVGGGPETEGVGDIDENCPGLGSSVVSC